MYDFGQVKTKPQTKIELDGQHISQIGYNHA